MAFPNPADVAIQIDGICFLNLFALIELKLASGMTSDDRLKDLVDVQELIKVKKLSSDRTEDIHPYVREKYKELWNTVRSKTKRYVKIWNSKSLISDPYDIVSVVEKLLNTGDELNDMAADEVILVKNADVPEGCILLETTDADVAAKYDFHEESEYLDSDVGKKSDAGG